MKIYNYSPVTFEFLKETDARESPLEPGQYLIPANATIVIPPDVGAHQKAVFAPQAGTWSLHTDYRGVYYNKETKEVSSITAFDVTPADSVTATSPPASTTTDYEHYRFVDGQWTLNTDAKTAGQWAALRAERTRRIDSTVWLFERHQTQKAASISTSITDQKCAEWCTYWQALRDLPANTQDPGSPTWPSEPSA